MYKCQNICIKSEDTYPRVIFWFLPNLQRLNKITKSVCKKYKSEN